MIKLHPIADANHVCPYCHIPLRIIDWYMPGMRCLADLHCDQCRRDYYGDLLSGHGLYEPLLLDKSTGEVVYNPTHNAWWEQWMSDSYANRTDTPLPFEVKSFRPLRSEAVLLNCLDTLYGHCLLKLLNAQYYLDHHPELDLILIIPRMFAWMVPQGVAEVWVVDLALKRGIEWNEWLADQIHQRVELLEKCWLSVAYSHPHPRDFQIERFTSVQPFPLEAWSMRLAHPVITFIWRDDRVWDRGWRRTLPQRAVYRLRRELHLTHPPLMRQKQNVIKLANALRKALPTLEFTVVGLGKPGDLPSWIQDHRQQKIDEKTERAWCALYALSQLVIGIHGSNMLLPSAHAGSVIELMPPRWGNIVQDLLLREIDSRDALFRYRILPQTTSPHLTALIAVSLLQAYGDMRTRMGADYLDHAATDFQAIPKILADYLRVG